MKSLRILGLLGLCTVLFQMDPADVFSRGFPSELRDRFLNVRENWQNPPKATYIKVIYPERTSDDPAQEIYACNERFDLEQVNGIGDPVPTTSPMFEKQYDPLLSASALCNYVAAGGDMKPWVERAGHDTDNGNADGTPLQLWDVKAWCYDDERLGDDPYRIQLWPSMVILHCLDHRYLPEE